MAAKKEKAKGKQTKKQKAKRNFMNFIRDVSREDSTLGSVVLTELRKKGVTARKLHKFLADLGYNGVRLEEVTVMFRIYNTRGRVKNVVMESGY